jgi:hypothetical protein
MSQSSIIFTFPEPEQLHCHVLERTVALVWQCAVKNSENLIERLIEEVLKYHF